VQVEVRGNWLDGAARVWFQDSRVKGRIQSVQEVEDAVKPKVNPLEKEQSKAVRLYQARVEIEIGRDIQPGIYALRIVSPRGISTPVNFHVVESRIIVEPPGSHQRVEEAIRLELPGFINGKIERPAEVDTYAFRAFEGQRFRFESIKGQEMAAGKFAPALELDRAGGSWFDQQRLVRLLFEEEQSSDLMAVEAQGTYQFTNDGMYFLQVSGLFGQGCPDCTYAVRVFASDRPAGFAAQEEKPREDWSERSLARNLTRDWITRVAGRSVQVERATLGDSPTAAAKTATEQFREDDFRPSSNVDSVPVLVESKTGDASIKPPTVRLPAVIEGTVGTPGEVDSFRFTAQAGQKLAVEVECPEARPPYFNPRLGVVDSEDRELFSNAHRRLSMYNNNAEPQVYLKPVEPKATFRFEREGEYQLQVRDITSRYGDASFRYRILLRPQIPHIGEIAVLERDSGDDMSLPGIELNRLNIRREEPKKIVLVASYEEGFTGDLAFTFEGLPQDVRAYPATQFNEGRAPLEVTQNAEIVAPKRQKSTVVLIAGAEAPLTSEPRLIRLYCQPISNGKLGAKLLVREIPLMVVERVDPKNRAQVEK
jgi:hypothetical protein